MNIKKNKLALALSCTVFLMTPLTNVFAQGSDDEMSMTMEQQSSTMQSIENELRAYVKAYKVDNTKNMQSHIASLIKLSRVAKTEIPVNMKMDHATMGMSGMDHSTIGMSEMDHAKMDHSKMGMSGMDDSTSTMKGMTAEQHQQHMAYIKNVTALQHSFEKLANAQDKAQKIRLFKEIKMNIKINNLLNHYSV